MVGTAVYQVGLVSSSQAKKRSALKPGVHDTDAPAPSDDSVAAISPWMWNSGMMLRQRSAGVSASAAPMWRAEAARFAVDKGTIFGRAVVPDVWSTRAISLASLGPVLAAFAGFSAETSRVKLPAGPPSVGTSSTIGTPTFSAIARTGLSMPFCTTHALGFRSSR